MRWFSDRDRYGSLPMALHWVMLVLLAAVYACMEFKGIFPRGSAGRSAIATWHYMLGLSVLALVVVRLLVAWRGVTPLVVPALPLWQSRLAAAMKWLLYAFMLITPLLGWLVLSARGVQVPFFGLQAPALVAMDKTLAGQLKEVHETLATAGYFLIGAHAAAALAHHYLWRDNTLARMLPARRGAGA